IAGLVGVIILGPRVGYGREPMAPHSLNMSATGGEGDDTFSYETSDVVRGSRHFGADTITDFKAGDSLDLSGLVGNAAVGDVVRLTETTEGTMIEAQIGRNGAFVDVVLLEDVFGLDANQLTDDGVLVG
ncbi:MAG: type I secretion C-terminal target domain-containing protein, partial [Pseudomonadota bacterium]